jgi:transcriptional regulator with XRE-family HTH domain
MAACGVCRGERKEVEVSEVRKTAEPAGELVRRLCRLKDESGRSLRELERATHASNSALSRYLSGQASPPWSVVVALCKEAGRDPRPLRPLWEEACEARKLRNAPTGGKAVRGKVAAAGGASANAREEASPPLARRRNDLPRDTPSFTAREAELAELTRLAKAGRAVAVDGMGGAGKTALAVRAAHALAGEFGDCQIFLDLHGFTPGREPVAAGEALRRLLGALDVPDGRIPAGVEERAALWRSELAGRRAVLVLDNARGAEQVRPLMPGAGTHAVIVTSRRRLVDLDGAEPLTVGCLAPHEAVAMFHALLDGLDGFDGGAPDGLAEGRAAADPRAVDELMARCACHPLAIRMTAARLKHRPQWTVGALDALPREVAEAVREILDTSLAVLSEAHRGLYAAILERGEGAPVAMHDARLLEDLVDVHLLEYVDAHRYRVACAALMRAASAQED